MDISDITNDKIKAAIKTIMNSADIESITDAFENIATELKNENITFSLADLQSDIVAMVERLATCGDGVNVGSQITGRTTLLYAGDIGGARAYEIAQRLVDDFRGMGGGNLGKMPPAIAYSSAPAADRGRKRAGAAGIMRLFPLATVVYAAG